VKARVFMEILTVDEVGFSHWLWIHELSQVNWFASLLGEGNNLESIFLISPVADLSDFHLLRMQERYCSPWGMGYSLICLRSPDPTIYLPVQPLQMISTNLR
jgi:hypothetical protein